MRTSLDDLVKDGKKLAKTGIFAQILCAAVLAVVAALQTDTGIVFSVIAGSAASIIPNAIFAFYSFRYSGARQSNLVHKSTAKGMQMKLIFTALIFVIAFRLTDAQPLFLFSAYAITAISFWLTIARR